jgi:hypothetical protein
LIIGDSQPTILLIPARNDGMVELWVNGVLGYWGDEMMGYLED